MNVVTCHPQRLMLRIVASTLILTFLCMDAGWFGVTRLYASAQNSTLSPKIAVLSPVLQGGFDALRRELMNGDLFSRKGDRNHARRALPLMLQQKKAGLPSPVISAKLENLSFNNQASWMKDIFRGFLTVRVNPVSPRTGWHGLSAKMGKAWSVEVRPEKQISGEKLLWLVFDETPWKDIHNFNRVDGDSIVFNRIQTLHKQMESFRKIIGLVDTPAELEQLLYPAFAKKRQHAIKFLSACIGCIPKTILRQ